METLMRVEKIKHPLEKGKSYLVPCIVRQADEKLYITPVINHPHDDKENGQYEPHYHVDYRFVKTKCESTLPTVINKHSKHHFVENIRPQEGLHGRLEYFILPMLDEKFIGITPVILIAKSKLKHKCIHKGKCPHKGYDLSQVKSIDGEITCPLHGIKFDAKSGMVLNFP